MKAQQVFILREHETDPGEVIAVTYVPEHRDRTPLGAQVSLLTPQGAFKTFLVTGFTLRLPEEGYGFDMYLRSS